MLFVEKLFRRSKTAACQGGSELTKGASIVDEGERPCGYGLSGSFLALAPGIRIAAMSQSPGSRATACDNLCVHRGPEKVMLEGVSGPFQAAHRSGLPRP